MGLAAKMAEVLGAVEGIPKRGHAEVRGATGSYSYDYILESDLMAALRPALAGRGVAVFYSDDIVYREGNLVSVRVSLTFVDGESGEERTVSAQGDGTDKGDKAANKAKTSAMRYLLWKMTLTPSDIDPEQENEARKNEPGPSLRARQGDGAATRGATRNAENEAPSQVADGSVAYLSDAQRRRVFALAREAGVTEDGLRAILERVTGQTSTAQIPRDRMDALEQEIRAA